MVTVGWDTSSLSALYSADTDAACVTCCGGAGIPCNPCESNGLTTPSQIEVTISGLTDIICHAGEPEGGVPGACGFSGGSYDFSGFSPAAALNDNTLTLDQTLSSCVWGPAVVATSGSVVYHSEDFFCGTGDDNCQVALDRIEVCLTRNASDVEVAMYFYDVEATGGTCLGGEWRDRTRIFVDCKIDECADCSSGISVVSSRWVDASSASVVITEL